MAGKTKAARFDKPCVTCGEMLYQVLERASSCASCSTLKNGAYRRNVYPGLMQGFEAAQNEGLTGEDARMRALEGIAAFRAERAAYLMAQESRKQEESQARAERARMNAFLRQHGYTWHKVAVGTEDDWAGAGSFYGGVGELDHYDWALCASDGRVVTVAQARQEIASAQAPQEAGRP